MKNFLTLSFVFFLIYGNVNIAAQKVKNSSSDSHFVLNSEKPKFQITFPGKFNTEENNTKNDLKSGLYRCVKSEDVFMLKFTEHNNPAVSSDNKVYTDAALESFTAGIHAALIKKYAFKEKKLKGLEAFMKIADKNLYVFYRLIIYKQVQYQIIVITKSNTETDEINNFFNSFKI